MKQLLALLLLTPLATADLVEVTLTLTPATPSENTLALALNVAGVGSSDTSETSGTIETQIEMDPTTGAISTLELISGEVSAMGVNFFAGNSFFTVYDISTSTLGATVDTPLTPAPVVGGQSDAELHELIINEGSLSGTSLAGDIPPQDFSVTNFAGSGSAGTFVNISATASTDSTPTTQVYDIEFTFPVAISQAIEEEGISGTITATGTVRATGQASFPVAPANPYLAWATTNGISEAPFEGSDFSHLLPNGLFWALGYGAGDSPSSLTPVGGGAGTFNLTPSASGTAADIAVQLSFDLSNPNGWTTINTIPAGTTAVQGPFGSGAGPAFLRLSVEEPST